LEKIALLESLPDEPQESETGAVKVLIRLPDGQSIQRRFRENDVFQVRYGLSMRLSVYTCVCAYYAVCGAYAVKCAACVLSV